MDLIVLLGTTLTFRVGFLLISLLSLTRSRIFVAADVQLCNGTVIYSRFNRYRFFCAFIQRLLIFDTLI